MERITFVVTKDEEATAFGQELTLNTVDTRALGGGTMLAPELSKFISPSHFQICCLLILKHFEEVKKWVEEKTFLRKCGTVACHIYRIRSCVVRAYS
jgi:hypothetical protein